MGTEVNGGYVLGELLHLASSIENYFGSKTATIIKLNAWPTRGNIMQTFFAELRIIGISHVAISRLCKAEFLYWKFDVSTYFYSENTHEKLSTNT